MFVRLHRHTHAGHACHAPVVRVVVPQTRRWRPTGTHSFSSMEAFTCSTCRINKSRHTHTHGLDQLSVIQSQGSSRYGGEHSNTATTHRRRRRTDG